MISPLSLRSCRWVSSLPMVGQCSTRATVNLDPRSPVNRVLTAALATRRGGRVDATPYRQAGHRGKLKLSRLRQRIADAYAAELGVAWNLLLREPLPDEQLADVRQLD